MSEWSVWKIYETKKINQLRLVVVSRWRLKWIVRNKRNCTYIQMLQEELFCFGVIWLFLVFRMRRHIFPGVIFILSDSSGEAFKMQMRERVCYWRRIGSKIASKCYCDFTPSKYETLRSVGFFHAHWDFSRPNLTYWRHCINKMVAYLQTNNSNLFFGLLLKMLNNGIRCYLSIELQ